MNTTNQILTMAALLLWLTGCGLFGCPDDEKVGEIDLHADTQALIPYHGSEVLTFSDSIGNALVLSGRGEEVAQNQLCLREICTEARIKGETSCEYVDSESRSYLYQSDSVIFEALFFTVLVDRDREMYSDVLRLSLSYGLSNITGYRLIKERDSNSLPSIFYLSDTLENIGTLTLRGEVYNDVWTNPEADFLKMYYTDAQGMIAFEVEDRLWTL